MHTRLCRVLCAVAWFVLAGTHASAGDLAHANGGDAGADAPGGCAETVGNLVQNPSFEVATAGVLAGWRVGPGGALAQKLGVNSIPALFLFKNGVVVDKMVGARPKGDIAAFIKKHA